MPKAIRIGLIGYGYTPNQLEYYQSFFIQVPFGQEISRDLTIGSRVSFNFSQPQLQPLNTTSFMVTDIVGRRILLDLPPHLSQFRKRWGTNIQDIAYYDSFNLIGLASTAQVGLANVNSIQSDAYVSVNGAPH